MRRAFAALLLLVALGAGPAAANPLLGGGGGAPAERAERVGPPAEPGPLARLGAAFVGVQREANAAIARHMRAIRDGGSSGALPVGLGLAFLYGVLHALGPGHGKLVVASYFVAREARVWRGLLMGAQIAVCHVISAVAIVAAADFLLSRALGAAPGEVRGVRLFSYGLIFAIGSVMLVQAWRRRRGDAARGHDHGHGHGCAACHAAAGADGRQQGLLSLGVGLVPCTGAVLIMLYAMANGILMAGIALVAMIALGMALTMAALGMLTILARRLVAARVAAGGAGGGQARLAGALDWAGALAITALGAALFMGAL